MREKGRYLHVSVSLPGNTIIHIAGTDRLLTLFLSNEAYRIFVQAVKYESRDAFLRTESMRGRGVIVAESLFPSLSVFVPYVDTSKR